VASTLGDEGGLEDFSKADLAKSLLRMISYNIAHVAWLNAKSSGLPRIFFGGFFIRGARGPLSPPLPSVP
jgi:type II pantothenate kinase